MVIKSVKQFAVG